MKTYSIKKMLLLIPFLAIAMMTNAATCPDGLGGLNISQQSASNCGSAAWTVTVTGGTGTLSYVWSGGNSVNTATDTFTSTNTYSVTVTDGNGCTTSGSQLVTVNTIPAAGISGTSTGCGSVILTASGGSSYTWSSGTSTGTAMDTFTTTGTYTVTVTVTGSDNCTATTTQSVTVKAIPNPTISGATSGCSPVILTATGGGTYAWSGGNDTSSASDGVTSSGTYTVTVTTNGCTATKTSSSVTVKPSPSALITPSGPASFCNGNDVMLTAPSTGDAIDFEGTGYVSATGYNVGTANFTVEAWIYPLATTRGVIVSQGGISCGIGYVFEYYDDTIELQTATSSGCQGTVLAGGLVLNQWQHVAVSVTRGSGGDQTTIYIDGVVEGSGNIPSGSLTNTSLTIGGSSTSGYDFDGVIDEVRIWNAALTQTSIQSSMYSVIPSNAPNLVTYYRFDEGSGTTPADIAGSTTGTLNGTYAWQDPSSAPVAENYAPTYNWSTGSFLQAIEVSSAGTYSVLVSDTNGCTTSDSFTVVESSSPVVTIDTVLPVCTGGTISLYASAPGGTSYAWSGPNGYTATTQSASVTNVVSASSGIYTVTVTNSNGCTASAYQEATVNASPVAQNTTDPVCLGSTISLTTGVAGDISYSWSGPNSFSSSQQNPTISDADSADAGQYIVMITNYNSCTANDTTTVTINNVYPSPSASTTTATVCAGSTVDLTSGPNGEASYSWSGPNGYTSSAQNPTFTGSTTAFSGTYTVTVDSNGCTASATVTVAVNAPNATATSNSPVCTGSNLNLSSGPSGEASYAWSGPDGFTSGEQDTSVTTINTGVYTVTITDTNGCTAIASTAVTTSGTPPLDTARNSGPVCAGATLNLTSTAATSYIWSGPDGFSSTSQNPDIGNTTAAQSGAYSVTVTAANGCTASASTNVTIDTLPLATAGNSTIGSQCAGENIYLSASGAGSNGSYSWSGPLGFQSTEPNDTIIAAGPAATGTYTVTVTNSTGCSATASTSLTVTDVPAVAITVLNDTICAGQNLELSADGGVTYSWSGPNGFTSSSQDTIILNATTAAAGTYTVSAANAGGCTATASTTISVNTLPVINACPGNLVFNSTSGQCSATIYFAANASGIPQPSIWYSQDPGTIFPVGTTNILVNASNTCGSATCSFDLTVVDNQPPQFACPANIAVLATEATGTKVLTIPVPTVTDNCGVASLVNSFNGTSNASGTYPTGTTDVVWTATDVNGNVSTCTQVITIYPILVVSGTATNTLCPGTFFGSITTLVAGGQTPYYYKWSNGSTAANLSNLAAGNYTVTVSDAASDVVTETFTISTDIPTTVPATPGAITGPAYVCAGATETYSIAPVPNTVSYSWTVPSGATILSGQGTTQITVQFPNSSSCGNIQVSAVNCVGTSGCGNAQLNVSLITTPSKPSSVLGPTGVCTAGAVYQYTVPATNGNYPLTYTWAVSATTASIVSGQGTNAVSIKFATGFTSGSVTVYASDCAGNSSTASLSVALSTSKPGAMNDIDVYPGLGSPSAVCPGQTVSYTVLNDVPANYVATYNWTAPANSTIISGQGTQVVTILFGAGYTGGSLSVYGSNCEGNGTAATQSIPLNTQVPGIPCYPFCSSPINGQNTGCPGDLLTYSINAISNAQSYTWTVPANTILVSGQGTTSITLSVEPAFSGGNVTVYASNCAGNGPTNYQFIDIADPPGNPCNIAGPSAVCPGIAYNYSASAGGEVESYLWTVPGNATIVSGQGTTSIWVLYQSGFSSGTISVTAVNCVSTSNYPATLPVYLQNQAPSCPGISGPNNACITSTEVYTAFWANGASSYTWTVPANTTIVSGQGSTTISLLFNTGYTGGKLSVVASNCFGSSTTTMTLTHNNCGVDDPAGITNVDTSPFDAVAYPNPFTGQFNIKITSSSNDPIDLKIFDVTGRMVDQRNSIGLDETVMGNDLGPGLYLVELKQGDNIKLLRVIKAE